LISNAAEITHSSSDIKTTILVAIIFTGNFSSPLSDFGEGVKQEEVRISQEQYENEHWVDRKHETQREQGRVGCLKQGKRQTVNRPNLGCFNK